MSQLDGGKVTLGSSNLPKGEYILRVVGTEHVYDSYVLQVVEQETKDGTRLVCRKSIFDYKTGLPGEPINSYRGARGAAFPFEEPPSLDLRGLPRHHAGPPDAAGQSRRGSNGRDHGVRPRRQLRVKVSHKGLIGSKALYLVDRQAKLAARPLRNSSHIIYRENRQEGLVLVLGAVDAKIDELVNLPSRHEARLKVVALGLLLEDQDPAAPHQMVAVRLLPVLKEVGLEDAPVPIGGLVGKDVADRPQHDGCRHKINQSQR
ncbi:hypothetical protein OIY81_1367 [Cryptosporidium canis]|uniref:Uncharacterized protein n=1 Tax=Cryptosporidium canis TaxID=195482 RepID=A0ABQ8P331_9CRYT|nr:hypothetical protein OJ252_3188 [Cryptosporidium canis]KAJ1612272.1 hypothetical protein OIY81_1367 [Cryptosporidium canis]